jgi:PilZ domain
MTTATPSSYRNRRNAMRKAPRGSVKVECRRGATGMGKNLVAQFLDLSEGGARLVLTEALGPRDEVEVLIFGPSQSKPLKRLANVCWSLPLEAGNFCIGLEFQKRLLFAEVSQNARP